MFDEKELEKIRAATEKWDQGAVQKATARSPERKATFTSISGMPVERLYTPQDVTQLDYIGDLGFPGEFPFTRGVQPTMYRGRFWTMRQYAGFGNAKESNERYRYLLEQGQTGLSVAFDLPTQAGYDSDHALSMGEVGKVGVAIDSLADMRVLFDQIPLDKVTTSMTINAPATVLLAMYLAIAEEQGVPFDKVGGTVQNDVLKEIICRGQYIYPPKPSMRLTVDLIDYCYKNVPKWNTISISGYHIREAGSTAAQEMAFTIADGIAYVQACVDRGLAVDSFGPRLSFFYNAFTNVLEEVAKFRAGRRYWAKVMKERFGSKDPRSMMMRYHVQTGGVTLTAQQPLNNIARSSYHALSAVLGGAQSVHVDGYDEALCTPTELSSLTALRTQQILQLETRVTHTIDPLAGSFFVESLTSQLEEKIETLLRQIEGRGGIVKAVEEGWVHREISDAAYEYQKDVENGEIPVVGVNCYQVEEKEHPVELFRVPETLAVQEAKLERVRRERDSHAAQKVLDEVARGCEADANLMEILVRGVPARVSEGEVTRVLKQCCGTWNPPLF